MAAHRPIPHGGKASAPLGRSGRGSFSLPSNSADLPMNAPAGAILNGREGKAPGADGRGALDIPLLRPRQRLELVANPTDLKARAAVLTFLHEHHRLVAAASGERRGSRYSLPAPSCQGPK